MQEITIHEFESLNTEEYEVFDEVSEEWVSYNKSCYSPEGGGFPKPEFANGIVDLITIQNIHTEQCYTWGIGPKPKDADSYTRYTECKDEYTLLKLFVETWEQFGIEIITGWNSNFFDLPYLINRITKICGEDIAKRLSPWGMVKCGVREYKGKSEIEFSITGVQCIDYIDLMKKFTYGGRESWKLDSIAKEELGEEKLKNPAETFEEFRSKFWDTFTLYNVHDARLVTKLEKKMKLIELAMTLAYEAKINFDEVYSPVKMWDAIIANKLLSENVVVPQRKSSGKPGFGIEGAYVKTPVPGFYEWVSSIDATSLYPSIIMTLNISPETFLGMTDSTVDKCVSGIYMNDNPNICMGANGALYDKTKRGIIPRLMEEFMAKRKTAKKLMLTKEQEREDAKKAGKDHSKLDQEISSLNNLQMAYKIALNSEYGAQANAGFRFFNPDTAESITTTGQLFLRYIENKIDTAIAHEFKMPQNSKFLIYCDTDSVVGDSLIYVDGKKVKIEDFYDKCNDFIVEDDFNKNFVKTTNESKTLSVNLKTKQIEEKKINYVMKHRVKKRMFQIKTGEKTVTVTEDHSVIILRNNRLMSVKPFEITKKDKILNIE